MYFVYILYSQKFNRYYIGHTNNLRIRLAQHNEGKSVSTRHYRPWQLVHKEICNTRSEALRVEKYLKTLKNKERIKQYIAGWRSSTLRGP